MKELSLLPDADMRWIYNPAHPRYNSEEAKDLRERRRAALNSAPKWMFETALTNDKLRTLK